jgi:hypothetical protein
MIAIHAAVVSGGGVDYYTGEALAWEQISKYRNEESKARRRLYKRELAMLPTDDHTGDGLGTADFQICAWRTNDCKNDLTHDELITFAQTVIAHHERRCNSVQTSTLSVNKPHNISEAWI